MKEGLANFFISGLVLISYRVSEVFTMISVRRLEDFQADRMISDISEVENVYTEVQGTRKEIIFGKIVVTNDYIIYI